MDRLRRPVERVREAGARAVDVLGRQPHPQEVAFGLRHAAARLDRRGDGARDDVARADDVRGGREGGLDVAAGLVPAQQLLRLGLERLVVDEHLLERVLGLGARSGEDRRDRLADVANLVVGEDRVGGVGDLDARRHDQRHRRAAPRGRRAVMTPAAPRSADPRPGVRAAHERDVHERRRARCRRRSACGRAGCVRPPAAGPGATDEHSRGARDPTASRITRRAAMPSAAPVSTTASPRIAAANSASSSASMSRGSNSTASPFSGKGAHLVDAHRPSRPHRAEVGAVVEHTFAALEPQREDVRRARTSPVSTPQRARLELERRPRRRRRSPRRCARARSGLSSARRGPPGTRACRRGGCRAASAARPGCARAARARRSAAVCRKREARLGEHNGAEAPSPTSAFARRAAPSRRNAMRRPSAPRRPPRTPRACARRPRRCRQSASRRTRACRAAQQAARRARSSEQRWTPRRRLAWRPSSAPLGDPSIANHDRARGRRAAARGGEPRRPHPRADHRHPHASCSRSQSATSGRALYGTFAHTWLPSSNSTNSPRGAASAARLVCSHGIRRSSLPVTNRAGWSSAARRRGRAPERGGGRPRRRPRATCARTSRA